MYEFDLQNSRITEADLAFKFVGSTYLKLKERQNKGLHGDQVIQNLDQEGIKALKVLFLPLD